MFKLTPQTRKKQAKNPKIAVVTLSGKAYFLIVNELKKREVSFLSLTLNDKIPIDIKAVITTKKEKSKVSHQNILEYAEDGNPAEIVEEAIRLVKGKGTYASLVIGIDPGSNFGVAVLGDKSLIETKNCVSVTETAKVINDILNRIPASHKTIRVGNGAPLITEELLRHLNSLQRDVKFEMISEEGTSQTLGETSHRRGKRDVISAIKIAQRRGRSLPRGKSGEPSH